MIVADTNLLAYLLLPGGRTPAVEAVLQQDASWAAPLLWRSEFRNVLVVYMRYRGMTLADAVVTMDRAELLLVDRSYALPSDAVLALAAEREISAYDAEFVVLAQELGVPLVSSDAKLLARVSDVAVSPEAFSAG